VALYLRHLKPNGILAIHTSNSYLSLDPVVKQLANTFRYPSVSVENEPEQDQGISLADWMLVTRNEQFLTLPVVEKGQHAVKDRTGLRLWTDDYNNLFEIMKPIHLASTN
jgi:hypothetical protein